MDKATVTVLIRNFILLAYADIFNERKYDMIGTTSEPNILAIYSYNFEEEKYEKAFDKDFRKSIYSVTPGNFTGNGKTSVIVTFIEAEIFSNVFVEFVIEKGKITDYKIQDLPDSKFPPMSITDYETARPAVVIGDSHMVKLLYYDTENNKIEVKDLIETEFELCKDHPYSFVDLDGDLKAELVVVVQKDTGEKIFNVYKYDPKHEYKDKKPSGHYTKIFEMPLPAGEIGPILFGDFTHKGLNSMVFISKGEGDAYFLNMFINDGDRHDAKYYKDNAAVVEPESNSSAIFSDSPRRYKKQLFSAIVTNCKPILKIDFSGNDLEMSKNLPGGIFATDIDLDGFVELFILVKKDGIKDTIVPFKLDEQENFTFYNKADDVFSLENIKSFSTIDYDNRGKENIILNRVKDGEMIVEGYFNTLNDINMKLSLTTTLKENQTASYGMGLPGVSYLIITNHGQQLSFTSNFGAGPFLSLNSQTSLIGLGDSTYMIDSLRLCIPAISKDYKEVYRISTNIIQNLDLIISVDKGGKYKIEAFFKIVKYFMKILYVLVIVGALNVLAWGIISWNQNKKLKLARTKDSMHPLFRSL